MGAPRAADSSVMASPRFADVVSDPTPGRKRKTADRRSAVWSGAGGAPLRGLWRGVRRRGVRAGRGAAVRARGDDPRDADVALRLGRQVVEQLPELRRVDGLLGDQLLREAVEPVAVRREDLRRPLERVVDDRPDLFVDLHRHVVAVVALLADLPAEEHELVALP